MTTSNDGNNLLYAALKNWYSTGYAAPFSLFNRNIALASHTELEHEIELAFGDDARRSSADKNKANQVLDRALTEWVNDPDVKKPSIRFKCLEQLLHLSELYGDTRLAASLRTVIQSAHYTRWSGDWKSLILGMYGWIVNAWIDEKTPANINEKNAINHLIRQIASQGDLLAKQDALIALVAALKFGPESMPLGNLKARLPTVPEMKDKDWFGALKERVKASCGDNRALISSELNAAGLSPYNVLLDMQKLLVRVVPTNTVLAKTRNRPVNQRNEENSEPELQAA